MVWWVRRFGTRAGRVGLGIALAAGACDGNDAGQSAGDGSGDTGASTADASGGASAGASTTGSASTEPSASTSTASASTDPAATEGSDSDPTDPTDPTTAQEGWLEVGYGLDAFHPFEDELPLSLGPQGFMMFSLPLRGGGFPVPPDPFDFKHPDTPVLTVWADIEGIEDAHPSGHFAAFLDYPVPFTLSQEPGVEYEFVSVWLVIPETYAPSELAGRQAVVHAELRCSDGQLLVDEHTLTVLDDTLGAGEGSGGLE